MKQAGLSLIIYSNDRDDVFPVIHSGSFSSPSDVAGDQQWFTPLINDYNYSTDYLHCPADQYYEKDHIVSYVINAMFTFGNKVSQTATSSRIVLSERGEDTAGVPWHHQCYPGMASPEQWKNKVSDSRHNGSANYLFADGHVGRHKLAETTGNNNITDNWHFVSEWSGSYADISH